MRQENGEEEEEGDPVLALEQRQLESQREMEIMDALQEIRARNARLDKTDTDTLLQTVVHGKRKLEPETETELEQRRAEEEDEEVVRRVFRREIRGSEPDAQNEDGPEESQAQQDAPRDNAAEQNGREAASAAHPAPADSTVVVKQVTGDTPSATLLLSDGARDHLASLSRSKAVPKRRRQNALGVVPKRT